MFAQSDHLPWFTTHPGVETSTRESWSLSTAPLNNGVPALNIAPAASGQVNISWTPPTPGFVLQETSEWSPPRWIDSPSLIYVPLPENGPPSVNVNTSSSTAEASYPFTVTATLIGSSVARTHSATGTVIVAKP